MTATTVVEWIPLACSLSHHLIGHDRLASHCKLTSECKLTGNQLQGMEATANWRSMASRIISFISTATLHRIRSNRRESPFNGIRPLLMIHTFNLIYSCSSQIRCAQPPPLLVGHLWLIDVARLTTWESQERITKEVCSDPSGWRVSSYYQYPG